MRWYRSFVLFGLFFLSSPAFSQQSGNSSSGNGAIVGLWQIHDSLVASGLDDNWKFYKDGHFSYNQNEALNPLRSISGTYYIKNDTIVYLKVTEISQMTGYQIIAPDPAVESGTFKIRGGMLKATAQDSKEYVDHPLKIAIKAGKKAIQIDGGDFYFKVANNPDAYK